MTDVRELYSRAYELFKEKDYDAAMELVAEVKRLNPKLKLPYVLEIKILDKQKEYWRLIPAIHRLLPHMKFSSLTEMYLTSDMLDILAHAQLDLAMLEDALKNFQLSAQLSDDASAAIRYGASIFCAGRVNNFSVNDFRVLYARYKKYLADIKPYPRRFYAHDKIRVGYLSGDFRKHPVIKMSWSLLTRLDKNRFATYCYSSNKKSDKITDCLRGHVEGWRDIRDLTDEQAAALIHDDEIDILFDLAGHTAGNRLRVAAYQPATVQISGIGYTNSTGLDAMDYFLTDVHCAGNPDYFTEKLIVLPRSHVCYEPLTKLEPAAAPPCLAKGYVTFGSFNQFNKITDEVLTAWKKILDDVPNSRLLLKNKLIGMSGGRDFVSDKLKKFGFDAERCELRGFTVNYLGEYADVDIALDTFPFTGGVTTCDALYMGVPVVNLYGERYGTRIGLSFLTNIGLEGFSTNSLDTYVKLAVGLAGDWDLLSLLRTNLRGMMIRSPLMDAASYIRDVEKVFVNLVTNCPPVV